MKRELIFYEMFESHSQYTTDHVTLNYIWRLVTKLTSFLLKEVWMLTDTINSKISIANYQSYFTCPNLNFCSLRLKLIDWLVFNGTSTHVGQFVSHAGRETGWVG